MINNKLITNLQKEFETKPLSH